MFRTNPWTYKVKKIIEGLYEMELLLNKYKWIIIQNKTGILKIGQSNMRLVKLCTYKKLKHAAGIGEFDLTATKDFTALKGEVDKLGLIINWLMLQQVWIN